MPPLPGFSDNVFQTRGDLEVAALALLRPLHKHFSPAKARVRTTSSTGTHFDENAAQLEGFARPLWVVGALLAAQRGKEKLQGSTQLSDVLQPWIDGLSAGVNETNPDEYWGSIQDGDQRMVEAEVVAVALLAAPEVLFHNQSPETQDRIVKWLEGMNGKWMPPTNWRWFRVFANLALVLVCGIPMHELTRQIEEDLSVLDSFHLGKGWNADGPWQTEDQAAAEMAHSKQTGRFDSVGVGRQVDYYSGSFAIQFSQLLFCKFASGLYPVRAERYKQQARDFGTTYWLYFDRAGAAIPFGRSLTYRFACGAFFAALAVVDVEHMPQPLASRGAVKGFLLRHLRWWARSSANIFHPDGTLNIGWSYPNMYMSEDYNSPQSPYWALKTFLPLMLHTDSTFWMASEEEYPASSAPQWLSQPQQILCNAPRGNHHFLLNIGQFVAWPLKASQAKYCKFAYSSAFPFSVPTGPLIQQIAPDNNLALSRDGCATWAVKWKSETAKLVAVELHDTDGKMVDIPSASVRWYPWVDRAVQVDTTIVSPCDAWPDWHIRVHRITALQKIPSLHWLEGGFAVPGHVATTDVALPVCRDSRRIELGSTECILESADGILIASRAGLSGLHQYCSLSSTVGPRKCYALKPDSNTSLAFPRSLIPVGAGEAYCKMTATSSTTIVTAVFGVATDDQHQNLVGQDYRYRWQEPPRVVVGDDRSRVTKPFIHIAT